MRSFDLAESRLIAPGQVLLLLLLLRGSGFKVGRQRGEQIFETGERNSQLPRSASFATSIAAVVLLENRLPNPIQVGLGYLGAGRRRGRLGSLLQRYRIA